MAVELQSGVNSVSCLGHGNLVLWRYPGARLKPAQFRLFRVPNCSPLSCHSRIGEHLPFAHGLVCKILISAGFVA
jgi:hypothetical protein